MKACRNKLCPNDNPQPPSNFNKRAGIDDGLQPYCRTCQQASNKRARTKFRATKSYNAKLARKANPLKYNAYRRLRAAVKRGQITKSPCEVCGDTNSKAFLAPPYHLPAKDLKPRWFCQGHHPMRSGNRKDPNED